MQAIFQNFGIYVHVPFCAGKCAYCRFYSRAPSPELADAYLDTIARELRLLEVENGAPIPRPQTMFWGGGTPSSLSEAHIARLADILKNHLPETEWTVEVSPSTATKSKLKLLRELGATRISLGVQSFSQKTLDVLGRRHSLAETLKAVDEVANAGFPNFSVDLIFGAKGQTLAEWEADMRRAAALPVNHISAYCLEFESGTSCCGGRLPDEIYEDREREADFLELAMGVLPSLGFAQYEISNYARNGAQCLHNISTWHMAQWVGLGPSAASQWRGKRRRNVMPLERWRKAILSGAPLYEDVVPLDDAEMFSSALIFGLRMNAGVNIAELKNRFPKADAAKYESALKTLSEEGLTAISEKIALTPRGRLLADSVAIELL